MVLSAPPPGMIGFWKMLILSGLFGVYKSQCSCGQIHLPFSSSQLSSKLYNISSHQPTWVIFKKGIKNVRGSREKIGVWIDHRRLKKKKKKKRERREEKGGGIKKEKTN